MKLEIEYIPISEIKAYPNNAKIHTAEQIEQIKKSIQEFGFNDPVGIWHGECVEGHGRIIAGLELGIEEVPIIRLDDLSDEQRKAYALVHNKLTMNTGFDVDLLRLELDDIFNIDMSEFGFFDDNVALDLELEEQKGSMADKYIVPPFSVIYANKPDWLARKRAWVEKGLRSELGRGSNLEENFAREQSDGKAERSKAFKNNTRLNSYMNKSKASTDGEEFEDSQMAINAEKGRLSDTGTSIFDPVLTEIMVSWFSAEGDAIIDPFAGGSVRGIVSGMLNRHYTGVDLRKEQIDANVEQGELLKPDIRPKWICGDSMNIDSLACGQYNFLLTCPPYGNLEIYSDDPADISNMGDADFDKAYAEILKKSVSMLKDNRFAVIVVGNYRDKKGYLRDLVGTTVNAMENAGARYYNDFIIVTPIGSLPIRAGKAFEASRKMGRTHQYCLVFVKGNPKEATKRIGDVEIPDMKMYEEDAERGD